MDINGVINVVRRALTVDGKLEGVRNEAYDHGDGRFDIDCRSNWGGYHMVRAGVEDDDWPDFVGYDEVVERVTTWLKGTGWELDGVSDSEKHWFVVTVRKETGHA